MKQYWLFSLNSLINIAFCAIDGAFGNNISIDAIIVMGSFAILEPLGTQFLVIGGHAYKVLQSYEKSCCLLSVLVGVLLGSICITWGYNLTFVFDLTETQREMLRQVLVCYGICCPIEALGRFMQRYITLKCYNKLVLVSNFVTYILLIGTDWLAISLGWGCSGLVLSTEFTWLVYAVILLITAKFFSQEDKVQWGCIKKALLVGKDLMLGGLISRGSNLCLGYFASTMGTEQYAIHSVALGAVQLAEEFRDAQCDYVIVKLQNRDRHKEQKAKRVFKQCWLPALLLPIIASFVLIFIMHGKVDLVESLYGVALYCLPMILYPVYDTVQQFAISRGKTKYTIMNSVICAIWRIGALALCSISIGINLIVLAGAYFFDYLSRTLFYVFRLKHDKRVRISASQKESSGTCWEADDSF